MAGIKKYVERERAEGQTLVAIDSGANVNFDRLRHVAERAELGERREAIIAVTIPERPGSFKAFCEAVGKRQITEFNYRYHSGSEAHIFVGVQTHPENDPREALVAYLREKGFPVLDLTDNELAKLHIRHMVGGHAVKVSDEMVFRFEFPSGPARCSTSSPSSAGAGTSRCSTTVTMARPTAGWWPGCRCRKTSAT